MRDVGDASWHSHDERPPISSTNDDHSSMPPKISHRLIWFFDSVNQVDSLQNVNLRVTVKSL